MEIENEAKPCDAHVHAVPDEFVDHVFTGSTYEVIPHTAACVSFRRQHQSEGDGYMVRCGRCNVGGWQTTKDWRGGCARIEIA